MKKELREFAMNMLREAEVVQPGTIMGVFAHAAESMNLDIMRDIEQTFGEAQGRERHKEMVAIIRVVEQLNQVLPQMEAIIKGVEAEFASDAKAEGISEQAKAATDALLTKHMLQ